MRKAKKSSDGMKIKGMFRVHIDDNGKIVGDSGWRKNQVTDLGFQHYLVESLGSVSGSKYISHIALGTGTAPAAAATVLAGEITAASGRAAVTAAVVASKTLRLTATFVSSQAFTASKAIQNIGLFYTSAATTGSIFAGNQYTASNVATNQNVNATYDIVFS